MSNSFLGTGWSFPPTFDAFSNTVLMTSDEADIQLSIQILLATRKGERVMVPDYGCNLDEMLFEPITTTFKTYISEMIRTAILYYEPRIDLHSVQIDDSQDAGGIINILLDYSVRTTNSRFNFVYPFYKNEGTEIQ
ncbi:GPW/gp25 family protein [soil metagenome]|jgi:phage baseplate assembly protein W